MQREASESDVCEEIMTFTLEVLSLLDMLVHLYSVDVVAFLLETIMLSEMSCLPILWHAGFVSWRNPHPEWMHPRSHSSPIAHQHWEGHSRNIPTTLCFPLGCSGHWSLE